MSDEKRDDGGAVGFPVMYGRTDAAGPARIPWSVAEEAYSVYSAKWGVDQSLRRIAERGGFWANELDHLCPGWRELAEKRRRSTP